jgi:hypothetical protein
LAVGARAEPFGDAPRVRAWAAIWRPFVVGILFGGTLATIEDAPAGRELQEGPARSPPKGAGD